MLHHKQAIWTVSDKRYDAETEQELIHYLCSADSSRSVLFRSTLLYCYYDSHPFASQFKLHLYLK
jgi:hypothetical protein